MNLSISRTLDFAINNIFRWPLALAFLYYYPTIIAFFFQAFLLHIENVNLIFFLGAAVFLLTNFTYNNKFLTFEHELTHAIFCFFTFKDDIRIAIDSPEPGVAGTCSYKNGTNWLIQLAPYFFPTLTLFIALIYLVIDVKYYLLLDAMMGYTIAYHIKTNAMELIASIQGSPTSDTQKAGRIFSLIVIPPLNLIMFGVIFIFIA